MKKISKMYSSEEKVTRGLRNKNPFNIRFSYNSWLGKVKYSKNSDKVFEQFRHIDYGLRAGIQLLRGYITRGYDTPRKIINRFAPSSENDTNSYLHFVCEFMDVSPDTKISFNSFDFFNLCAAICKYESHYDFVPDKYRFICKGFRLCEPFNSLI